MDSVTIKELAEALQLSAGTVSKALKDSHEISAETKMRVLAMAEKLNYVPNPYASSLRKRKSKTIAVVIPEIADSFFSLAINGIEEVAQQKGYHVLIYLTHENFEKEKNILHEFVSGRADGLLISVSGETTKDTHIEALKKNNVPVVFFDRAFTTSENAKVITNDFESGMLAAKHLVEKGCRKIAFLSISNCLSICNARMEGYEKILAENNMEINAKQILLCSNNEAENLNAIKKLLSLKERPDGIIISVEKLIIPVYTICRELQLQIPHDVKLIAFSNLSSAFILNPSLTTITQPAFEIGKTAATLLFKSLEKQNFDLTKEQVIIPSVLQQRDSTL